MQNVPIRNEFMYVLCLKTIKNKQNQTNKKKKSSTKYNAALHDMNQLLHFTFSTLESLGMI